MPKKASTTKGRAAEAMPLGEANATVVTEVLHGCKTDVSGELEGPGEPHVVPQATARGPAIIGQGAKATNASKQNLVIARLKTPRGATVAKLMEITGWQKHTVRGFLSAVVRKKLDLPLISETGRDGSRRYRIAKAGEGSCA